MVFGLLDRMDYSCETYLLRIDAGVFNKIYLRWDCYTKVTKNRNNWNLYIFVFFYIFIGNEIIYQDDNQKFLQVVIQTSDKVILLAS